MKLFLIVTFFITYLSFTFAYNFTIKMLVKLYAEVKYFSIFVRIYIRAINLNKNITKK